MSVSSVIIPVFLPLTTVLRRSSAEGKTVGKSLVNSLFPIRVNHEKNEPECDLGLSY